MTAMRVAIIINGRAGGVIGPLGSPPQGAKFAVTVERLFTTAGVEAQAYLVAGDELASAVAGVVRGGVDAVVVGGGDGSIGAAAGVLAGTGVSLGVFPLGTMNLLGRDLGLPASLPDLVNIVVAGHTRDIDVAEVNGRVYLNNAVLGLYPTLVRLRERQRGGTGWRQWASLVLALARVIRYHNVVRLRADLGRGPEDLATAALAVVNNVTHDRVLSPGAGATLCEGRLAVYVARRCSMARLLVLLAQLIFGWRYRDPEMQFLTGETLRVESRKRRLKLSVDGEVVRMAPPLEFRIRPRALRVFVPKS